MTKKFIFSMFLLVGMTVAMTAQQAIKLGPLGFLLGNYNLRYEKALTTNTSYQVGVNFYDYDLISIKTTGFGLDAGWRKYFKEAIRGGYIYPSASYNFNSTSVSIFDDTKGSFSNLNVGATVGYQWVAGGGFVTDLGLGYGYNIGISKSDVFAEDRDLGTGGRVRFTFAIGYSF